MTLRSQGEALKLQQEALRQQQDDIHKQRFESSFFELLRLLRECRDQISFSQSLGNNANGIKAINQAVMAIIMRRTNKEAFPNQGTCIDIYKNSVHAYSEISLSPYFRVTYRILDRLKKDKILSRDEKLSYAKLLRGQLSSSELSLMGLNGKLDLAKDFSTLLTEFRMLKYLPPGTIRTELESLYPHQAFMGHDD